MAQIKINTGDFFNKYKNFKAKIGKVVGNAAATYFKENITSRKGNESGSFKPRIPGTRRDSGRNILVDKGALIRSIRILEEKETYVLVGVDPKALPYAQIHQEGGNIPVTDKMKSFFWAMYYQASKGITKQTKGSVQLGSKKAQKLINLSAEASLWKALALKPIGSTINIPKRTFMEISPKLEAYIQTEIATFIKENKLDKF